MLRKQWQEYALKAKQIAKNIVSGDEVNKDGVRLTVVTDKLDIYATDALNMKYSGNGSKASVHTYPGGEQEIETQHADGSNGLFKSNDKYQNTDKPMDIEVKVYMNNNKNESKNMNQKIIRLTESDLHKIVRESVNKVLNEGKLGTTYDDLEQIQQLLSDITNSEFIPFTSPSPSSTEQELKNSIIEAARLIDKSLYLCTQLGYHNPTAHIS